VSTFVPFGKSSYELIIKFKIYEAMGFLMREHKRLQNEITNGKSDEFDLLEHNAV
jgi:hypothetical protein